MKLIVQIPCLNEAESLPGTLRPIPRRIDGIDRVAVRALGRCPGTPGLD